MSYTVIITNKLFNGGTVKYWKINRSIPGVGDSPSTAVTVGTEPTSVSMALSEMLRVQADAFSMEMPVFLAIDSPSPYGITIEKIATGPGIVWDLDFGNYMEKSAVRSMVEATDGTPPVNVTVGQDEPKGKTARLARVIYTGAATALFAASAPIYNYSKTLWFVITGVLAASFIGTAVYYVFSKRNGNKVQNDENR